MPKPRNIFNVEFDNIDEQVRFGAELDVPMCDHGYDCVYTEDGSMPDPMVCKRYCRVIKEVTK